MHLRSGLKKENSRKVNAKFNSEIKVNSYII